MPDISKRKLSDEELKVLVDSELESAMGYMDSELSSDRRIAMERFYGEPIGTEMEGRSQVQTRDVMETIEWIMPTLLRIFTDKDRAMEFTPVGPEDEQQAEQETDYLNYLFYKQLGGFKILYCWFFDALLQKNGQVKSYVEVIEKDERQTYEGLLDIELQSLMADDDYEIIEKETRTEQIAVDGQVMDVQVHDVVLERVKSETVYNVDVMPPEEFLISKDAIEVDPSSARFCAHRTTKTVSDLREMGYSDEDIGMMELGENEVEISQEKIARMNLDGEERWFDANTINMSMRKVKWNECYMYVDKNGDGKAELLKIFRSGDFIDYEEMDYHPIDSLTPTMIPHKHFGLSIADKLRDIQEIRTHLRRAYMDNVNQTINGTTYYDENTVNVDDMLSSTPYGNRAVDGPPGQSILHIPPSAIPSEVYSLEELLDKDIHNRVGEFQAQLDPHVLAQANTGVVVKMLNEAKSKVELIARIFAEVGVTELFRTLHHLVRKHSDQETRYKLKNEWVPVKPQEWKERQNMTINVGLGTQSNMEMMANIQNILNTQMQAVQMGVPVVMPQNIYNAAIEMVEMMGEMGEKFFTHPQMIPPPPPQPDVQEAFVQVEAQKVEVEREKIQLEHQRKVFELQQRVAEAEQKAQTETDKNMLAAMKEEMGQVKQLSDQRMKEMELMLKEREMTLKEDSAAAKVALEQAESVKSAVLEQNKLALEEYKVDSNNMLEAAKLIQAENESIKDMVGKVMADVQELQVPEAQDVRYDENGRIIGIGDKEVVRDNEGNPIGVRKTRR